MKTNRAIYQGGVFRPLERVDLPEGTEVWFELHVAEKLDWPVPSAEVMAILGERFNSGQHDVSERHNEHQP